MSKTWTTNVAWSICSSQSTKFSSKNLVRFTHKTCTKLLIAEDISQSLPNMISAEENSTPSTQPTDLTKLFALNQSLDETTLKNKSFFASLKGTWKLSLIFHDFLSTGWNETKVSSTTASKENVSNDFSWRCFKKKSVRVSRKMTKFFKKFK